MPPKKRFPINPCNPQSNAYLTDRLTTPEATPHTPRSAPTAGKQVRGSPRRIPSAKWRELIKKEWEADPLLCPICQREMRIVLIIDDRRDFGAVLADPTSF